MSKLYLVATPIGNLEDISFRAVRILQEVSLIAAEDTRTTKTLLAKYNIETPLISYHDHNKERKTSRLLEHLEISDLNTSAWSERTNNSTISIWIGNRFVFIPGLSAEEKESQDGSPGRSTGYSLDPSLPGNTTSIGGFIG